MTRDELRALADELESNLYQPHKRAATFIRQIADATPERWRVEVRRKDRARGMEWERYGVYNSVESAEHSADGFARLGDMEARVVPLYRLPLED